MLGVYQIYAIRFWLDWGRSICIAYFDRLVGAA